MAWNFTNSPNIPRFNWRHGNDLDQYPEGHPHYVWNDDEEVRFEFQSVAPRYELRNWKGEVIQSGNTSLTMSLGILAPGYYRMYLTQPGQNDQYTKDYAGSIHISVWRRKAGMMDKPTIAGEAHTLGSLNVTSLRLTPINALETVDQEIATALAELQEFEAAYMDYPDAMRPQKNYVIHFADGTREAGWDEGVRKVVAAFGTENVWYECRNEPDTTLPTPDTFVPELQQFYNYVKAANPNARVLGPNQVSIDGGQYNWTRRFFELGGGNYVDGFSFHAYNACSGELDRGRFNAQRLVDLLTEFGQQNKPRWMTEWGSFATNYGSYIPMRQVRWLTMEILLWEQYGVPREHWFYFYLRSHGFWDYPSFVLTDTFGFLPAGTALRVLAGETFGKAYAQRLDFGKEDRDFIGSRYNGTTEDEIVLMACGRHGDELEFTVGGGLTSVTVIDAMGKASTAPVTGGKLKLAIPGAPVYIRLPRGTAFSYALKNFGTNLVQQGMYATVTASTGSDVSQLANNPRPPIYPYWGDSPLPITINMKLGQMSSFDTVYIRGNQPWQLRSAILDGYVEVKTDNTWTRIGTIANNYTSFEFITGWRDTACYVESFFDERFAWYFTSSEVLRSDELRLVVTRATWGGEFAETRQFIPDGDGGQGMDKECLSLQGIEVYRMNKSPGSGGGTGSGPVSGRVIIRKP